MKATAAPELFDVELPRAPYPGLRPFEQDEWPVFFGREVMTGEAIRRLLRQNLLVVHGDSGCGKSSLIRAGVLVQLERRHARSAHRWRTCTMLPREAPLRRLAEALAGLKQGEPSPDLVRQIRRALNAGRGAAAKLEDLLCGDPRDRVCILADQFEELFRFAKEASVDEARLFVDVLVGLLEEAERRRKAGTDHLRLYAILTTRSEFLGACARFEGLAEAVNETQYLLPRMERAALLRAICEPAALYGGEVSRELAERLIADAGSDQDQLPLIQHGLMLLWRSKASPSILMQGLSDAAAPFDHQAGPAWRLGVADYQTAGDLGSLLSAHADDVMAEACRVPGTEKQDPVRHKIVEHLFRALIDINAEGQAVRRPQTLADLVQVTGSDEQVLREIIDRFRADGVSFLRPYDSEWIALRNEIDISHEALIRCWTSIASKEEGWLQREFQDGLTWQSLRMQADKFSKDPEEILSPASTIDRDAWLTTLPSKDWCRRYRGGWEDVQSLMHASRDARARQIAKDRWIRKGLISVSIVLLVLAALAGWNWWQATRAETEAQLGDSLFRSVQARAQLDGGFPVTAMQLALAGLPERAERPWVGDTAGALVEAMAAQREITALHGHEGVVFAAGFSPAGDRIVSGGEDGTVRLWDAASGAELKLLRGHEGGILAAEFSPAGDRIVSGGQDGTVRLWDAASGAELKLLRGHEGGILAAGFAPAGDRIVSSGEDGTVRLWGAASGAELRLLRGHEGGVLAAGFSPAGDRIVSGGDDGTVRLWDAASGAELKLLRGHEGGVRAAGFAPSGDRIVSGGDDGTVRLWDAASGEELQLLRHEGWVRAAGFSPASDRIVSGADDGTVRVWDAASGEELLELRGHEGGVRAAGFSQAGGRIVSSSYDNTVRVWDVGNSSELRILRGHEGWVRALALSADGARIVSASADGTVRLWDAGSGKERRVLRGHESWIGAVAFSPDGARIASGSGDNTVRMWDAESREELVVLRGHAEAVRAVAFSPDGTRIVSGSHDGTVRVWNPDTREELMVLRGHDAAVWAAAFSPDGTRIVSGSEDKTVRVWDAQSGEQVRVLRGHAGWVHTAGFSPDGAHIVSGSEDGTIRVWDVESGAERLVLGGHEDWVWSAAFSPDGQRIVSGSKDGSVRVWDAKSGAALLVLRGHGGDDVYDAEFSPDGSRIGSASKDRTVRVTWVARSKQELIDTAQARLPREPTPEERQRFHLAVE